MSNFLLKLEQELCNSSPKQLPMSPLIIKPDPAKKASFSCELFQKYLTATLPPLMIKKKQAVPINTLCKKLMAKYSTLIEFSSNKLGELTFIISGLQMSTCLRELVYSIANHESIQVPVPHHCTSFVYGKSRATLKQITSETFCQIKIPPTVDSDGITTVTITGDCVGIELARQKIESIIASRDDFYSLSIKVDQALLPFITSHRDFILFQNNVKIFCYYNEGAEAQIDLVGKKSHCLEAKETIQKIHNHVKKNGKTLMITVPKRQHHLIVGAKGSKLAEFLKKTGCIVTVPHQTSDDTNITLYGPEEMLPAAIQMVLDSANTVSFIVVPMSGLVPSEDNWIARHIYVKEWDVLEQFQITHSCGIFLQGATAFEIQGSTPDKLAACGKDLTDYIRKTVCEDLCFRSVEFLSYLHGFVIGKKGQYLERFLGLERWNGRLINIVFTTVDSNPDRVCLVVKRMNPKKDPFDQDSQEDLDFLSQVHSALLEYGKQMSETSFDQFEVHNQYVGRLIGVNGSFLRQLMEPYGPDIVGIKVVQEKPVSRVIVRGPNHLVKQLRQDIIKILQEWEYMDKMRFTARVAIPPEFAETLVGSNCRHTRWIRTIQKEQYKAKKFNLLPSEKDFEADLLEEKVFLTYGVNEEKNEIAITGPRSLVASAKKIIEEKVQELSAMVVHCFDLFAYEPQQPISMDNKDQSIKKLLGKEGHQLKQISSAHKVSVHIDTDVETYGHITLKGLLPNCIAAQEEMQGIIKDWITSNYELKFEFEKTVLPYVMGRNNKNIHDIRNTGVRIDMSHTDPILCTVRGEKSKCQAAQVKIMGHISDHLDFGETVLHVPFYLHRHIIGPGGGTVERIINENSGINIVFAKNKNSNIIKISGPRFKFKRVQECIDNELLTTIGGKFKGLTAMTDVDANIKISNLDLTFAYGHNYIGLLTLMKEYGVTLWLQKQSAKDSVIFAAHEDLNISTKCIEMIKVDYLIQTKIRQSKSLTLPTTVTARFEFYKPQLDRIVSQIKGKAMQVVLENEKITVLGRGNLQETVTQIESRIRDIVNDLKETKLKSPKILGDEEEEIQVIVDLNPDIDSSDSRPQSVNEVRRGKFVGLGIRMSSLE